MVDRVCSAAPEQGRKPDVLLVADNGHSGGIGRYCVDLAQSLGSRACVVCLCPESCSAEQRCWLSNQCQERQLQLVSVSMPTKAWGKGLRGLMSLWKDEGRPIVHTNGRRGNFIALLAKSLHDDFAFATTVHGVLGLHARRNAAYRLIDLGASWAADAVIAVSVDTRRRLAVAGVPERKTLTITNGLMYDDMHRLTAVADARSSETRSAEGPCVGFLGRLSPEKGSDEFARLALKLAAKTTKITFAVAGGGPSAADFQSKVKGLVATGRLRYAGDILDPVTFLQDIDILVMPSHNEGLPYVLLEALAAGCAIVAYGVGGIPEVVSDRSVGSLVRPHDFDGLVAAVSQLIEEPALARSMGQAASARVRSRYALDQRIPLLLRAYEMCARARPCASSEVCASRRGEVQ